MIIKIINIIIFLFILSKDQLCAEEYPERYPVEEYDEKHFHNGFNNAFNAALNQSLICNPGCKALLYKVELHYQNIPYPRLCNYQRSYSNNLIYKVYTKYHLHPIPTVLSNSFINETRIDGNLNIISIGYVDDNSCYTIRGATFLAFFDLPNLHADSCCSVEGLTRQAGAGEIIFSTIDRQDLYRLWTTNTPNQLKRLFYDNSIAFCAGCATYTYTPGLLDQKHSDLYHPTPEPLNTRETIHYSDYTLRDCDYGLSGNVLSVREVMTGHIKDSCEAIESPRIKNNITIDMHVLAVGQNGTEFVSKTEVELIFFKHIRTNGNYKSTTIGVVVNGPKRLIGTTYLEIIDLPNLHPFGCLSEPGITHLSGTAEKIFAKINVRNLLSVLDLDSVIQKIRINRIVDCLGCITIYYKPGLITVDRVLAPVIEAVIEANATLSSATISAPILSSMSTSEVSSEETNTPLIDISVDTKPDPN